MTEYVVDLTNAEVRPGLSDISALWGLPVFERIVRCRDCVHYADHEWVLVTDVSDVCHFFGDGVKVEPDGFCKWGELREVD